MSRQTQTHQGPQVGNQDAVYFCATFWGSCLATVNKDPERSSGQADGIILWSGQNAPALRSIVLPTSLGSVIIIVLAS